MSSSNSAPSISSTTAPIEQEENASLWKFVTRIIKRGDGGSGNEWVCNNRNTEFQGSYFRVKAYLFLVKNQGIRGCPYVKERPDGSLRTTLLQKERSHIERLLEPTKKSWQDKGLSVVTDGWTDAQRRPLINLMAASEGTTMFLKAFNCEGETNDMNFIAKLIGEVIDEVRPQNVVQVITDNGVAAGLIIQNKYSNIFWTPCVVHTLNLALKNICAAKQTGAFVFDFDE